MNSFVSVLAWEEVNRDSIILMKHILVKCDRNKEKWKKDTEGTIYEEKATRWKCVKIMHVHADEKGKKRDIEN